VQEGAGGDALELLRRLSGVVADAVTVDEVARATLLTVLEMPGVMRVGLAVTTQGGRQLRFVSTDDDSLTPTQVRWCLIDAFAEVPLTEAIRRGEDLYFPTIQEMQAVYPGVGARHERMGTRAEATLSLVSDDESVGGLMLCYREPQTFDTTERWVLGALAAQAGQGIRRALVHQERHSTAEQLQRSLMPRSLPALPGLDLGAHFRPGGVSNDVGGDWYDVIDLADGSVAVALGDVMGRGTTAAILMSEMRAALRAYAVLDPAPATVLARLDELVMTQPANEQLIVLAYGVVSPDRRTLRLALAGHPPPLRIAPDGSVEVLTDGSGPALGLGAGPWHEISVDLTPRPLVMLYSDGLVETRDRDLFDGIDELVDHVAAIPARRRQPRDLCTRLAHLMADGSSDDDVTLIALAPVEAEAVLRASVHLPGEAVAPRLARAFLRETLRGWAVEEETLEAAELCVSELVTNAVIHTGTAAELTTQLDPEFLTVLVRDGGTSGSVQLSADPDDPLMISGRGLGLVDAVATAWAAEESADGTTVWFEIERVAAEAATAG
jgi:serine phosphatase RsbU (regulator of sigma subunit)/anti-sigma regulatory factor (Ser/Thr protein kinase)